MALENDGIHILKDDSGLNAMAMMNNNPWMYLVMLALFGNGGFGWGGNRGGAGVNGVLDMETQNKLNSLQAQINDNNNNQWAREAIQGNGFAISQLAQNLNVDYNAINLGNLNLVQQLKDCCCGLKTQILEQGYQNQLQTVNQTNEITTSQRVENGLTRAEIASFRQAWENARYQDVVAEKTRLQTELDLLRTQQGTAALMAPMQAELKQLEWQMQQFINTYSGGSGRTNTAAANG